MSEIADNKGAGVTSNPASSQPLQTTTLRNDATGVAILLSNHDTFGFSERLVSEYPFVYNHHKVYMIC